MVLRNFIVEFRFFKVLGKCFIIEFILDVGKVGDEVLDLGKFGLSIVIEKFRIGYWILDVVFFVRFISIFKRSVSFCFIRSRCKVGGYYVFRLVRRLLVEEFF